MSQISPRCGKVAAIASTVRWVTWQGPTTAIRPPIATCGSRFCGGGLGRTLAPQPNDLAPRNAQDRQGWRSGTKAFVQAATARRSPRAARRRLPKRRGWFCPLVAPFSSPPALLRLSPVLFPLSRTLDRARGWGFRFHAALTGVGAPTPVLELV